MKVYVVTRPDLGWDCVVGVYRNKKGLVELMEEIEYDSDPEVEQHTNYSRMDVADLMDELGNHDYIVHTETLQ